MSCPFDRWGPSARCLGDAALGSAAERYRRSKERPAAPPHRGPCRGGPGPPPGAHGAVRVAEQDTKPNWAATRTAAARAALRQPPTHTTATSAPATSSRRTTTHRKIKTRQHGQVHGLRRQGVRDEARVSKYEMLLMYTFKETDRTFPVKKRAGQTASNLI